MKKVFTFITTALMALTTSTLMTSCDNDAYEARTLDGSWTGYIETYYADRWGLSGNSYRTTMYFNQTDRYGGNGYEVDYDSYSPYRDYYYCEFVWEVYNGIIRIKYADSWNDVLIYDYRLSSNYFEGYMDDGTTRGIYFQLAYNGSFNWSPYRDYYYAPEMRRAGTTDVVAGEGFCAKGVFADKARLNTQSTIE